MIFAINLAMVAQISQPHAQAPRARTREVSHYVQLHSSPWRPWLIVTSAICMMIAFAGPALAAVRSEASGTASPTITTSGNRHVSARIIPLQKSDGGPTVPTKVNSSGSWCEINVCMDIQGNGLHIDNWTITAGQIAPLQPGECTFGTFWIPGSTPFKDGPELCNTTNGPALYQVSLDDITVSTSVDVCSSAVNFTGKPCMLVYG